MNPLKSSQWILLLFSSILSVWIWISLSYSRYQIIDLSFNRHQVGEIARNYVLKNMGVNLQDYKQVITFVVDTNADCYLQRTLGPQEAKSFINSRSYDLFYWVVRYFKEKQKEEFKVVVSSKTGEIIVYSHSIEDIAPRPLMDQQKAKVLAQSFLAENFKFDPMVHVLHSQNIQQQEKRVDYSFVWESKLVDIPWDARLGGGKAKLLVSVTVSGGEILYFNKSQLSMPEGFSRYVESLRQTGANFSLIFKILYLGFLVIAIMLLINRKRHVVPRIVKPFYVFLGALLFVLIFLDIINSYQNILVSYSTTQSFNEYLFRSYVGACVDIFFIALIFVLPALSGEALRYESNPQKKNLGLLSNLLSSFWTVPVAQQIWVGYLMVSIVLALQAYIFQIGYKYFGVWNELSWMVQSSNAVLPALSVFVIGFHASFSEEIMFRLFIINLLKRYGAGTFAAVLISSIVWGFGHTGYAIFPMWFRGLEVTCLGFFFAFIYLRFGLISVITTHFLMDVFWSGLRYFINPTWNVDFITTVFVLLLPLMLSIMAWKVNRSSNEILLKMKFSPQQEFNYQLLKDLLNSKSSHERLEMKDRLIFHGWDPVIIERVYEDLGSHDD